MKVDVLTSAEETKIKEAGGLQEQVNMFTSIVAAKDSQVSDVLQGFVESSDSHVAQLLINHGNEAEWSFCFLCFDLNKTWIKDSSLVSDTDLQALLQSYLLVFTHLYIQPWPDFPDLLSSSLVLRAS